MAANYNPILDHMYRAYSKSKYRHQNCDCCCSPPPWLIFNGPVNANCYPLYNLPKPETPCSAATKQYVDQKTNNSGSIQIQQDRNTAQSITKIAIENLDDNIPAILTALSDITEQEIENLRRRLKSFYTRNITNNSFELVLNMEANFEKIIANGSSNLISALVNMNGRPAISLPFASMPGGGNYPNPALFRSNNGTGDAGLTEITPSSGMGVTLGIIGGRPATVFIRNGEVIYSRCSNADGTGNWNNITVDSNRNITGVSDPIELNGGVYFLMRCDSEITKRIVYSAINTDFNGSGTWHITKVGTFGRSTRLFYPLHPIAINTKPGFAIDDVKTDFDITLFYYEADDSLGTNWNSTKLGDFSTMYNPTAIVTSTNQVGVYYASNKEGLTGQIRNSNGQFIPLSSPILIGSGILDMLDVTNLEFSFSVVNGNVAVSYFYFDAGDIFPFTFNLIYQYSDPFGRNWKDPIPIEQYNTIDDEVRSIRLADINNAPCVVASLIQSTNSYFYYRGGDPSTFVSDADVNANYSIN